MDEEAEARATNAQPWEPLPGMVKRQCPGCRYFFAAPAASGPVSLCPDCATLGTRAAAHAYVALGHPILRCRRMNRVAPETHRA